MTQGTPVYCVPSAGELRRLLHDSSDTPTVSVNPLPGVNETSFTLTLLYIGERDGQVTVEGMVDGQKVVLHGDAPGTPDAPLNLWIEQ